MKKISAILIGAGGRGFAYVYYMSFIKDKYQVVLDSINSTEKLVSGVDDAKNESMLQWMIQNARNAAAKEISLIQ